MNRTISIALLLTIPFLLADNGLAGDSQFTPPAAAGIYTFMNDGVAIEFPMMSMSWLGVDGQKHMIDDMSRTELDDMRDILVQETNRLVAIADEYELVISERIKRHQKDMWYDGVAMYSLMDEHLQGIRVKARNLRRLTDMPAPTDPVLLKAYKSNIARYFAGTVMFMMGLNETFTVTYEEELKREKEKEKQNTNPRRKPRNKGRKTPHQLKAKGSPSMIG